MSVVVEKFACGLLFDFFLYFLARFFTKTAVFTALDCVVHLQFRYTFVRMAYSSEHKAFMVESYFRNGNKIDGVWRYSVEDCMTEFQEQFPNFAIDYMQFKKTLDTCISSFRETGSVQKRTSTGRPKKRTDEVIANAREIMQNTPKTSVRHLRQQMNTPLSLGTAHALVRKDLHMYPYRVTAVQELLPIDYPRRLEFCNWVINMENNESILEKLIFTDEAWFHLSGYLNSQNTRIWSTENPHEIIEVPLHPQKIGVWAAVTQRRIIGPIFFEGILTIFKLHIYITLSITFL
jgi:hypothetical protein